jgi:hypothetical protein
MKKRLHDKKAGIALLLAIIVVSLAEIIFRAVFAFDVMLTTSNLGEQIAAVIVAVILLVLTAKGKDRACYIIYGAWIGYFILDQIFELPGSISKLAASIGTNVVGDISLIIRILSMIAIIAIGCILIEYMNDGTIYNRAFNALCIVTVVLLLAGIVISVIDAINGAPVAYLLSAFNNVSRLTMIFMFTFFAYDSAKHQLKKVNLAK